MVDPNRFEGPKTEIDRFLVEERVRVATGLIAVGIVAKWVEDNPDRDVLISPGVFVDVDKNIDRGVSVAYDIRKSVTDVAEVVDRATDRAIEVLGQIGLWHEGDKLVLPDYFQGETRLFISSQTLAHFETPQEDVQT